jgi:predicted SprT family Zn-dependent metalloprotease
MNRDEYPNNPFDKLQQDELDEDKIQPKYIVKKYALEKMAEFGLTDWHFNWDKAVKRFGYCSYGKKRISISETLAMLNPWSQVKDTVLHELAHALAPRGSHHGPAWKRKCVEIGANPTRCYDEVVKQPRMKFTGTCPNGHTSGRMRKPRKDVSCGKCSRGFNRDFLITWRLT